MNPLNARRVNVDFELRLGLGQPRQQRRIELKGKVSLVSAGSVFLEIVGANRRLDNREKTPQDAVFVQVCHRIQSAFDLNRPSLRLDSRVSGVRRVETGQEKFNQLPRDRRIVRQRLLYIRLSESETSLP